MIPQPPTAEAGDVAALGRMFLAVVLGLAVWAKLRDRGGFRAVLRFLVPWAPTPTITSLAAAVVGFEALLAGLLVAGFRTDVGAWGTVVFLCVGTAALLALRRRGYQGGCACFGDHASAGPRAPWTSFEMRCSSPSRSRSHSLRRRSSRCGRFPPRRSPSLPRPRWVSSFRTA